MKVFKATAVSLSMAAICAFSQGVAADSTSATCEFYSHGDKKKDRTGPCTFSQRQGNIDITLKNGKTFSLSPGNKPDHFKDQEDHKVVREKAAGDSQTYKWDEKRIVVTFNAHSANAPAAKGSAPSGGGIAVKDMAKYCVGEASAKFSQRPTNISAQPAIKDQGMYSVFGQYPPSGADPTVFICTFSADGKFVGVDKE